MRTIQNRNLIRLGIVFAFLVVIGMFLWSALVFLAQLKEEELTKMQIWVEAQTELLRSIDEGREINPVLLAVLEKNTTTPMILFSVKDDLYEAKNISEEEKSQEELVRLSQFFKTQNDPIEVYFEDQLYEVVYYGNSSFITKTKYAPFVIVIAVLLFLVALYYMYSISKSNEQNRLWAGMAKETAHQIGTPLSSLVGWVEILRSERVDQDYIAEMNKDIDRLNTIANRFSKIGSPPALDKADLVLVVSDTFEYMQRRSSKLIDFTLECSSGSIFCMLNASLLSWTIENLIKNAMDAVKGEGKIHLTVTQNKKWAILKLSDTGKGIPKRKFKRIFKPGETTKKRGWGLGLSLAKRIIEDYHHGKIKVLRSEINKGTTFVILLQKLSTE